MDLCFVIKRPTSPLQSEGRLDYSPYVYSLLHWVRYVQLSIARSAVHLNREKKPYDKSDHVYLEHMDMFQEVPFISASIDARLMQHYILEFVVDSFLFL
ncbi:hypothetical protein AVEN_268269-1 [Araneus ventricosus]|uniref:Uncharacterized protein n=1 Tax=Araneus ventricosus TaxID=182803 RepID=A0A4Y2C128_ARAVE|nr:hypothetical protein AVEN_268269-1 [Araneus ventricosus]